MVRKSMSNSKGKNKPNSTSKPRHKSSGKSFKNKPSSKSVNIKYNNSRKFKKPATNSNDKVRIKKATAKQVPCLKEEQPSSDSEPDAFSQLVSCFSDVSKKISVLSDEDSSSDGMEGVDEDEVSVENNDLLTAPLIEQDGKDDNSYHSESEEDMDLNNISGMNSNMDKIIMENFITSSDPFENHIQYDLDENLYNAVSSVPQQTEELIKNWPVLGQLKIVLPKPKITSQSKKLISIDDDAIYAKSGNTPVRIENVSSADWEQLFVKSQFQENILRANRKYVCESLNEKENMTPLQKELFSILNNYQDLYFPERTLDNGEEVRLVYSLHTINHVLKTRLKVVHHNARLANKQDLKGEIPDEFRDQGLVRPKVLILVPFRNSALRVVEMLASILLEEENNNVLNKKRFYDEFTAGEIAMPRKNPKPEDYEKTFTGDTDDNFKLGISITKKSLKLYADFYSADIIVASPLGLRVIVGAEGQPDRDFDFLASIELLILDQAEIIFMQNWDHLLHLWEHLHMQPRESHGTNFARVRPWALSGRARYYRQTLIFSSHALPQISALFSRKCYNYAGKVYVVNPVSTGTICQIVLQLPQVFDRIECNSATESIDARFHYFINKVLPQFKEPMMSHTLIYVPSYFDYVRIRNHFKKETISFVQICEYSKDGKIARARDMFFHSSAHFLLYSERFHFFRRIRLKGIQHIVFYQPPTIPHFYSELCNLMQQDKLSGDGSLSVSVLYTKYDAVQLAALVGSERAAKMLSSDRLVHMFMTGD